jgi:hypothetical protein
MLAKHPAILLVAVLVHAGLLGLGPVEAAMRGGNAGGGVSSLTSHFETEAQQRQQQQQKQPATASGYGNAGSTQANRKMRGVPQSPVTSPIDEVKATSAYKEEERLLSGKKPVVKREFRVNADKVSPKFGNIQGQLLGVGVGGGGGGGLPGKKQGGPGAGGGSEGSGQPRPVGRLAKGAGDFILQKKPETASSEGGDDAGSSDNTTPEQQQQEPPHTTTGSNDEPSSSPSKGPVEPPTPPKLPPVEYGQKKPLKIVKTGQASKIGAGTSGGGRSNVGGGHSNVGGPSHDGGPSTTEGVRRANSGGTNPVAEQAAQKAGSLRPTEVQAKKETGGAMNPIAQEAMGFKLRKTSAGSGGAGQKAPDDQQRGVFQRPALRKVGQDV